MLEEIRLGVPQLATTAPAKAAEAELTALVAAHASTLFRVAHAVLRNRAEAEDAVQDAFVRVLEHRSELPRVRELRPWLVRITWRCALDRRRRKRPEQADDLFLQSLPCRDASLEQRLSGAEQSRRVLAKLDKLPEAERQALLLSAIEELSTREVAEAMGKSESAVRSLLHRGRTHLVERLGKEGVR